MKLIMYHFRSILPKGGGEMVLSQLLKIGKQRGHELRLNTCSPNNNDSFIDQDLTLIADIFNCPGKNKV